ncbi:MAG: radical SAM protein [Sedimentisphaerales bacterium]|nr:radical SAM protein [Sedimentisphaerales bacterium]
MTDYANGDRTVCVAFANGCPRARVNAALFREYFQANGWKTCSDLRRAQLVVVFGCAVNARSERKAIRLLSAADRRRKPDSTLVIAGCAAGIAEKKLSERFDAFLLPPASNDLLDDLIGAEKKMHTIEDPNLIQPCIKNAQGCFGFLDRFVSEFEVSTLFLGRVVDKIRNKHAGAPDDNVFLIRIARGCLDECTYCAVRFAHGPLVSKPPDEILREFRKGIEAGYEHFVILAGDIGAYGQDIGMNIAELLERLLTCEGDFSLHLKEFNPRWFVMYQAEVLRVLRQYGARVKSIIFPIQSGNERILKLMKRQYTAKQLRDCLDELRVAVPHAQLLTHIVVGFPGETEEEFNDTTEFLTYAKFDDIAVYAYEDRPLTESAHMAGKVSARTKKRRMFRLLREFPGVAHPAL